MSDFFSKTWSDTFRSVLVYTPLCNDPINIFSLDGEVILSNGVNQNAVEKASELFTPEKVCKANSQNSAFDFK